MSRYRYSTSEKSFLDTRHDALWNDTVKWIYHTYPKVTPNQLTLLGALPVIGIVLLHIIGVFGFITFPLLSIAIVWYLNMDAMDGKLARYSNRSTPIGQVLDHGLDALIGGFITVAMISFFGLSNIFFNSIGLILTTALFFQATLKEHLTGEMIVSMKFNMGRNTSIVVSTTELLYAISFIFLFGSFTFYGDYIFSIPFGFSLIFVLLYLNETMIRMNLLYLKNKNTNNKDIETTNTSNKYSGYLEEKKLRRRRAKNSKNSKKAKHYSSKARPQIYDANMRPIGSYSGFDTFPQPEEIHVDSSDPEDESDESVENPRSGSQSYSISGISMPTISMLGSIDLSWIHDTPYFTFCLTQLISLGMYLMTFGSGLQLVSMITYITTVTIDLIFLNTLKLDLSDKKSKILVKRFSSRNTIIFGVIKLIAYLLGLLGVITGFVNTTSLAYGMASAVDIFFIMFYAVDMYDKTDIVTSYLEK